MGGDDSTYSDHTRDALSAYEHGRRSPSPEAWCSATSARIGSVARGDDEPGSDVDLLVEFTDEASLLDEVGLRLALRDLLQIDVDVVATDALRGEIRERILRDAVPV